MRINAVVEPMKYNEHREFNDTTEHNEKSNKDNEDATFFEILKQTIKVKEYLYSK